MYFTSGKDRAFERLMQEKPGFNHYDGGGANAPEDCGSCRFYRPDWKYQFCVYAECPYQPGKLTALAAVKFTVKGADDDMAVFRVEKNKGYTVMSNHHLRNKALSLKAKGLLSHISVQTALILSDRAYRSLNEPDISSVQGYGMTMGTFEERSTKFIQRHTVQARMYLHWKIQRW